MLSLTCLRVQDNQMRKDIGTFNGSFSVMSEGDKGA